MGAAIPIRTDIPADAPRRLARQEGNGRVACRLLALANALAGRSREDAARQAGMDRQTLRDWVIRFNAEGVEGLGDRPKSGRPAWLDDGQLATLKALVLRGPDPERDGVSTWRAKDLCRIVEQCFGVSYTGTGMLRLLHELGLWWQKARPAHPEADLKARARFKKIPRTDRRDRPRPPRGRAVGGLVPGRRPGRPDRPRLAVLVRTGHAPARGARPAPCGAWNALLAETGRIRSLCTLDCATQVTS